MSFADYKQNQLNEASYTYTQKEGAGKISYTINEVNYYTGSVKIDLDNIQNIDIPQLIKDAYNNYLEFFN